MPGRCRPGARDRPPRARRRRSPPARFRPPPRPALRVERVAGHGRALDERARDGRECGELDLDGAEHRARDRRRRAAGGARQLGQVQQVAAGVARHPLAVRASAQQPEARATRRGPAARAAAPRTRPAGVPRRAHAAPGRRAARSDRQQVRAGGRALHEMVDELERRIVGPVQIVEQESDRDARARAARAARAARGGDSGGRRGRRLGRRRHHLGQSGSERRHVGGRHRSACASKASTARLNGT